MNHVHDNNSVQVGFVDGVLTEFVDAGQHHWDSAELRRLCEQRDYAREEARKCWHEIARLRGALRFYADEVNWRSMSVMERGPLVDDDLGDRARDALTQQEQEK